MRVRIRHAGRWPGEVEARAQVLAEWVRAGRPPACRSEPGRCASCGLGPFCDELERYARDGVLEALNDPPCLGFGRRRAAKFLKATTDPGKVLKFAMRHRIFIKTRECAACGYEPSCAGLPLSETLRRAH